ncbi:hypothetical protein FGG08_000994 [Glutinoglossum americanum]|uniref:Fungal lipase-type domain-containing protein n=1 Tax=Glutinoglossum americanum TaxID=1670608 RepID=A0A9P8I7Y3_9PEZI|nr:hypothetical protein FGG08_000994 [Glutinoglossum americanum]
MTIFKKRKLQKTEAMPNATIYGSPAQPSMPAPYLNPRPSQSVQYLAPGPPTRPNPPYPPHPPHPQYQGNSEWGRSQPSFHFKTGSMLASQSYFPLKSKRSGYLPGGNNAKWSSTSNIPNMMASQAQYVNPGGDEQHQQAAECSNQGAVLMDLISDKFDNVITLIDGENFSGDEKDLVVHENSTLGIRGGGVTGTRAMSRGANTAISTAVTSTNYFAKANLYANSRLPQNLPPIRFYLPTYPLLCLAASYSQRVYVKPTSSERETHVNADWRMGTKAMVIKSVPIDNINTVVFAIRGSQTFMDWAVNLNSAPASPSGFLDDPGNLCHSGFLSVARKMVKPVAARLRSHSAGGAVASLLYAHMMARDVHSEMNFLTGCFKRIHCVTFGAPPVSLLPLQKPDAPQFKKSLFLSFINEGDPVPRADKAYVRSLIDLYAAPAPGQSCPILPLIPQPKPGRFFKKHKPMKTKLTHVTNSEVWEVPPTSLSNAGKLVVLRPSKPGSEQDVAVCVTTDEQLRGVVFGDPVKHMMKLYASRIETLATNAVLARGGT